MPTAGEVLVGLGVFFFVLWIPLAVGVVMRQLWNDEERSRERRLPGS
jgi:hypothetical protein